MIVVTIKWNKMCSVTHVFIWLFLQTIKRFNYICQTLLGKNLGSSTFQSLLLL